MKAVSVNIDSIHIDPANLRMHPARNLDTIKASLARFGQQKPIVVDGNGICRAGNGTLEAARALGWEKIDVVKTPLAGSEAIAYAIADNRTAELALWDDDRLGETLKALQLEDFNLDDIGFSQDEFDELLGPEPGEAADDPGAQIDRAEELQAKWKTARGQLWEIGRHRLLCGDSTKAEDVAKVMRGEKADLCFTSPPYDQQRQYENGIGDWNQLMRGVFGNLPMADAGQVLVNLGLVHRDGEWVPYWDGWIQWMREQGWRRFGWYVWDQMSGFPGVFGGRCAPSFEFIFHFNGSTTKAEKSVPTSSEGTTRHGGRMGPNGWTTDYHIDRMNTTGDSKIPDATWRFNRQTLGLGHPAIFPVDLPYLAMKTWPGDTYEPFAGSGTTLVAAEQTGRVCFGIEIEPKYCAVILERMAGMKLEPVLSQPAAN